MNIEDQISYGGTWDQLLIAQNNFDVNESLSWIKGKHTFKLGFEYLKSQSNDVYTTEIPDGPLTLVKVESAPAWFSFAGDLKGTGHGMASFLLGLVDDGGAAVYASGNY